MAAPEPVPFLLRARLNERRRLRIVDNRKFTVKLQPLPIHFIGGKKNLEIFPSRHVGSAVQGVMKSLRHFKKILAPGNNVPPRTKSEFVHERNQAIQNLSHSPTHGR